MTNGQSQNNGLGIAGFVVSLVSLLCLGGLISPVSLIMCAIAMRREPKGLAIAGLILSIIGSAGFIILFVAIGFGTVMAALGLGMAAAIVADVEKAQDEMADIAQSIRQVESAQGAAPESLDTLNLSTDAATDPWGNAYVYETTEDGWRLYSIGFDEQAGTPDDVEYDGR